MTKVLLQSAHPPAECWRRLDAAWDPDWPVLRALTGSRPVLGRRTWSGIRLRARPRAGDNAFTLHLYARITATSDGSRIEGRFRRATSLILFQIEWFAGVIVLGGGMWLLALLVLLDGSRALGQMWPFLVIPPALLAGGIWFHRKGRRDAAPDAHLLRAFLQRTLEAHEVPACATRPNAT